MISPGQTGNLPRSLLIKCPENLPEEGGDPCTDLLPDLQFFALKLQEDAVKGFACQEIIKVGVDRLETSQPAGHTVRYSIPFVGQGGP